MKFLSFFTFFTKPLEKNDNNDNNDEDFSYLPYDEEDGWIIVPITKLPLNLQEKVTETIEANGITFIGLICE